MLEDKDEGDRTPHPNIPWAEISSKKKDTATKRCQFKIKCVFGMQCRCEHTNIHELSFVYPSTFGKRMLMVRVRNRSIVTADGESKEQIYSHS